MQDVVLRGVRDGQDLLRPLGSHGHHRARVQVRGPIRQVLREPQMNAVVNRHDVGSRRQRRDHVVRGMEEVHPCPPQVEGHGQLFLDRIVTGRLDERLETGTLGPEGLGVLRPAEQHVGVSAVIPGKFAQDVADVRADAVVVQFPRVDGYSHDVLSADSSGWRGPGAVSRLRAPTPSPAGASRRRVDGCGRSAGGWMPVGIPPTGLARARPRPPA